MEDTSESIIKLLRKLEDEYDFDVIESLSHNKVFKVKIGDKVKVLTLFRDSKCTLSLQKILDVYKTFSEKEITPKVYFAEIIDKDYAFIISEYMPYTLLDVLNKTTSSRERLALINSAKNLCIQIEKMGYYNQDTHSCNFVSDGKKLYGIDFDELVDNYKIGCKFEGSIYDLE